MATGVTPGATGRLRREVAAEGSRPRALGRVLLLAVLVLLAVGQMLYLVGVIAAKAGLNAYASTNDLAATLTGARIIRDGDGARLYDLGTQRAAQEQVVAPYITLGEDTLLPYIHPPFEAMLAAPLLGVPPGVLFLLWNGLMVLATAGSVLLLARALPLAEGTRWPLIAAIVAFAPLHQVLQMGQSSPLVLLGLCGAYVALRRGQEGWAGAALALMVVKPQMLLVLGVVVLLQRRWRALLVCGGILAALSVAAMPILGPLWPLHYARFLAGIGRWGGNHNEYPSIMHNWRGLVYHLLGGSTTGTAGPLIGALTLASLGLLLWVCWRHRAALGEQREGAASDLTWALACLIAILAAPHLYIHDLTLLIFPAWVIVHRLRAEGWPRPLATIWLALLWAGFVLPLGFMFRSEAYLFFPTVPTTLLIVAGAGLLVWQLTRQGVRREA